MMERRSPVWIFFTICEDDENKASCNICKMVLSRGGKRHTTTPLNNHMSYKHPQEFKEVISKRIASAQIENPSNEVSLSLDVTDVAYTEVTTTEMITDKKVWAVDSAEAYRIHVAIGKMMAVDIQPYSIVEDVGFKDLVGMLEPRYEMPDTTFFSKKIIPEMYNTVRACVQSQIDDAKYISLVKNTWVTQCTTECLISLSAHWINDSFERKNALLHCKHFAGKHSELSLAEAILETLTEWHINSQKVHLVLHDDGANVSITMNEANLASTNCFLHTLQFVLHETVLCQPFIADVIISARRIVEHIKHSSTENCQLNQIQPELALPTQELGQDVETQWISTYYMLDYLLERKQTLALLNIEIRDLPEMHLTAYQWNLISLVVTLLKPFEQLTREINNTNSCLSMILPAVQTIFLCLQKEIWQNDIIKIVAEILTSLKHRLVPLFEDGLLLVSSGLDPRFKLNFLSEEQKINAKAEIIASVTFTQLERDAAGKIVQVEATSPVSKKPRVTSDDFWTLWDSMQTCSNQSVGNNSIHVENQLNTFLEEPCISRDIDPVSWWQINSDRFPALRCCAQRFLAAPPRSIPSESLFITGSSTFSDKRSCLLAENLERLTFLKANISYMQF